MINATDFELMFATTSDVVLSGAKKQKKEQRFSLI